MNPEDIINDIKDHYAEWFEHMDETQKLNFICKDLTRRLIWETELKNYYKTCFEVSSSTYRGINS